MCEFLVANEPPALKSMRPLVDLGENLFGST